MTCVSLKPGESFFSERPATVDTILGSCLGIVMRHRDGATCVAHCVLPRANGENAEPGCTARFVDQSLEQMLAFFERRGISHDQLEVKLFGGSQILTTGPVGRMPPVGQQNLEAALAFLGREGIPVSAQDTGGRRGRRILVDSSTGEVQVRYIRSLPPAAMVNRAIP
jgi:chemotaxis protein CheD